MPRLTLGKQHKLCGALAVDALFARDGAGDIHASLAYPLRVVWRPDAARRHGAPMQFVIVVPKRRLRHAVDRVTMRRRIREAYRLNRLMVDLEDVVAPVDMAFIYVADGLKPYADIERAMRRLLTRVSDKLPRQ